jgi:hypothetical protein
MPRGKAGGPVKGTVGKPYPNRTDLVSAEPVSTAKSQNYGERSQQQAAQRAVPLAPPASPPGVPGSQPPAQLPNTSGATAPVAGPGLLPFLHPTNRPNEPVTAGLPTGAGPGPEALTGVGAIVANQAVEQGTLKNLLGSLASSPTSSSAIRDLAAVAGAG